MNTQLWENLVTEMSLIKHTACNRENFGNWDAIHWTHGCERVLVNGMSFHLIHGLSERILVTGALLHGCTWENPRYLGFHFIKHMAVSEEIPVTGMSFHSTHNPEMQAIYQGKKKKQTFPSCEHIFICFIISTKYTWVNQNIKNISTKDTLGFFAYFIPHNNSLIEPWMLLSTGCGGSQCSNTNLTHWGLVTPFGDIDLGQHWLR